MKKYLAYILATIYFALLPVIGLYTYSFVASLFNHYPIDGNYYIDIYAQDNSVKYYPNYYSKLIYNDHIASFKNIEIYPSIVKNYNIIIKKKDISNENVVIGSLLENGYAKIIDESIANQELLQKQNQAKENKLGIWATPTLPNAPVHSGKEIIPSILSFIVDFYKENWWIRWIIAPFISFSFIVSIIVEIYKYFTKTKRIKVLFAGDKASGKTTLMRAWKDPDLSEAELLKSVPTKSFSFERIIRDDMGNKRRTLSASSLDYPGDDNYNILNFLNKSIFKKYQKCYVVLILSPTPQNNSNTYDEKYILDQYYTVQKLWTAIIKSKPHNKISKFILFINKNDLFINKSDLKQCFAKHSTILKDTCLQAKVDFHLIVGSTIKKDGFEILKRLFLEE